MTDTRKNSLDPNINPWKRGDVCTKNLEGTGFVVNCTADYIEVLWADNSVERFPKDLCDVLRFAHADSLAPDGNCTNLQKLESIENLYVIAAAIKERTFKDEREEREVNALVCRACASDGCDWDKKHVAQLMTLAIRPQDVGILFKVREWLHRRMCKQVHHLPR